VFEEIWKVVRRIPKGKVTTYGAVALAAGFPGAARQVVWALRASKGSIPWHRVLGANGKILLAGTQGAEQRLRLRLEGVTFRGDRADLKKCGWVNKRKRRNG
jgi:methylated-DNA-protein-cysteine methyltransferase-like protein